MKKIFTITLSLLLAAGLLAQAEQEKLAQTIREFHQDLVSSNTVSLNQHTDKDLSYGHSNGWVETKEELIDHLKTGYMKYDRYKEDGLVVTIGGNNIAHARFTADITATLNGNKADFRLSVLEVWVKKGRRWILFARQAVKM